MNTYSTDPGIIRESKMTYPTKMIPSFTYDSFCDKFHFSPSILEFYGAKQFFSKVLSSMKDQDIQYQLQFDPPIFLAYLKINILNTKCDISVYNI